MDAVTLRFALLPIDCDSLFRALLGVSVTLVSMRLARWRCARGEKPKASEKESIAGENQNSESHSDKDLITR